jgi:NADP-dependent 3-hydroxy acid dehydrogenase YdfG
MTQGIQDRVVVITVAFAMSQPDDVDVNEILFRPTRQEL